MKNMKRVISLAVVICMAISMAVLFSGCDESISGKDLPGEWMGTYKSSDGQTIKIVAKSGDGIYKNCPKLYGDGAYIAASPKGSSEVMAYAPIKNDTIQTAYKKDDGSYTFHYYDNGVLTVYDYDCRFWKKGSGKHTRHYLTVSVDVTIKIGGLYISEEVHYYGSATFTKQ